MFHSNCMVLSGWYFRTNAWRNADVKRLFPVGHAGSRAKLRDEASQDSRRSVT